VAIRSRSTRSTSSGVAFGRSRARGSTTIASVILVSRIRNPTVPAVPGS
jgi:hypothetical protein